MSGAVNDVYRVAERVIGHDRVTARKLGGTDRHNVQHRRIVCLNTVRSPPFKYAYYVAVLTDGQKVLMMLQSRIQ